MSYEVLILDIPDILSPCLVVIDSLLLNKIISLFFFTMLGQQNNNSI